MHGDNPNKTPRKLWVGRTIVTRGVHAVGTEDFGIEAISHMLTGIAIDAPNEFKTRIQNRARGMLDSPDDTSFKNYHDKALQSVASRKFAA